MLIFSTFLLSLAKRSIMKMNFSLTTPLPTNEINLELPSPRWQLPEIFPPLHMSSYLQSFLKVSSRGVFPGRNHLDLIIELKRHHSGYFWWVLLVVCEAGVALHPRQMVDTRTSQAQMPYSLTSPKCLAMPGKRVSFLIPLQSRTPHPPDSAALSRIPCLWFQDSQASLLSNERSGIPEKKSCFPIPDDKEN